MTKQAIVLACIALAVITSCKKPQQTNDNTATETCNSACSLSCERPNTASIDDLLTVLETHSPVGNAVVNRYLNGCVDDEDKVEVFSSYIHTNVISNQLTVDEPRADDATLDRLASLNLIVHELSHAVAGQYSSASASCCETNTKSRYSVGPNQVVEVKFTATFPSKELERFVPPSIQNNGFFQGYVTEEAHASQALGIYALLDEFIAYSNDTRTSLELWPMFEQRYQSNNDDMNLAAVTWMIENGTSAHLEFKYFQLAYLAYAKQQHPEVHKAIMQNSRFWEAFNSADQQFVQTIDAYETLLAQEPALAAQSYYSDQQAFRAELEQAISGLDWQ